MTTPDDSPDGGRSDVHGRRLGSRPEDWIDDVAPDARAIEPRTEHDAPIAPELVDRRALLRLMSASLALAGLGGCNTGTHHGAPLLSEPHGTPGLQPGEPVTFASTLELDGLGRGVLVQARDGRPIKIEGNPLHPASLGATDAFMQAEVLSLYDPERSRTPVESGQDRAWSELHAALRAQLAALAVRSGAGLALLTGPLGSPTAARLVGSLGQALPELRWYVHAPAADTRATSGARAAFGRPVDVWPNLSVADLVLCLGADPLGAGPLQARLARDLAERRRRGHADGHMPRLVVAEALPTLTGARADERIVCTPDQLVPFARLVASAAGGAGIPAGEAPPGLAADAGRIGRALARAGGSGLVLAGREASAEVHALAHAINVRIGAVGRSVRVIEPVRTSDRTDTGTLAGLTADIAAGRVTHLVGIETNPVYSAPADLGNLAGLIGRVPFSLHLGLRRDETARACRWHVPARHSLEAWGDTVAFDGTVGLRQPATLPRIEALSAIELLGVLTGGPADGRALVEATWRERLGAGFAERWPIMLEAGVMEGTASAPADVALQADWAERVRAATPPPPGRAEGSDTAPPAVTVVLAPDPCVWDGSLAGNAWLQELPKPLTKQVWGNAALLAPATAARLGIASGDIVRLDAGGGRTVEAAALAHPGTAPGVLGLTLGYGRRHGAGVGDGLGSDAYRLRTSAEPWVIGSVAISRAGRHRPPVTTQAHHTLAGGDIVRAVATAGTAAAPAATPGTRLPTLYPEWPYPGRAWGMTVDLDQCIGCNACVVACQAENNVSVVGPEQVARGREMHWLRIDRYWSGPTEAPATCFQPMYCQHCEKAPCEVVCPVNATVHDSEGLNVMVYNRCIGTRTCSNNCPYKVRRFNWLDYRVRPPGSPREAVNPEVTVRRLGVMEKCTYCVQRIKTATITAGIEGRPVRDGEIVTACQQACPTGAFTFGDVNDPASAVSGAKASPRAYAVLGELNTRPRTSYLARIVPPGEASDTGTRT